MKAEILISSESDEEIGIKREPYSPEMKPVRSDNSDDIDGKFLPAAKRKKIDDNTTQNSIQVTVQFFFNPCWNFASMKQLKAMSKLLCLFS